MTAVVHGSKSIIITLCHIMKKLMAGQICNFRKYPYLPNKEGFF